VVVAGKLLAALERPFLIGPHHISISGSIGIAVYPQHGEEVNQLLKNADIAMYHAKKAGRNCYRFFREVTESRSLTCLITPALMSGLLQIAGVFVALLLIVFLIRSYQKRIDDAASPGQRSRPTQQGATGA
jgi:predicted signal transduction protein with EAL and GGDEF domain